MNITHQLSNIMFLLLLLLLLLFNLFVFYFLLCMCVFIYTFILGEEVKNLKNPIARKKLKHNLFAFVLPKMIVLIIAFLACRLPTNLCHPKNGHFLGIFARHLACFLPFPSTRIQENGVSHLCLDWKSSRILAQLQTRSMRMLGFLWHDVRMG